MNTKRVGLYMLVIVAFLFTGMDEIRHAIAWWNSEPDLAALQSQLKGKEVRGLIAAGTRAEWICYGDIEQRRFGPVTIARPVDTALIYVNNTTGKWGVAYTDAEFLTVGVSSGKVLRSGCPGKTACSKNFLEQTMKTRPETIPLGPWQILLNPIN
jgi:hypothetical protein